jgi:large subunit ribosomal protein L5
MEAATTTQQAVPPPRLRDTYNNEVLPQLMQKFGYSTPMRAPRLQKITLNMGLGSSVDSKAREKAIGELATIAGQMPNTRIAKKSIASFKLREGMPVGASVTLRGARMWEFLDRLTSIAIPRIRDFRGLKATSFDGRGNYSMGVREQLIFPEIDYDSVDETRGLDITITTSAPTDYEAFELLLGLGMPFAKEGRPVPEGAEESTGNDEVADAAKEEPAAEAAPAAEEAPAEEAAAEEETETQEDQA